MDEIKKESTEEKIMHAAHNVFLIKGLEGARMQEIADEAGINKALLHYYFRTKEKLFEAIFSAAFMHFFPGIGEIILSDIPFTQKISLFIDKYIDFLQKNPFLPLFIIKEINRDPKFFIKMVNLLGLNFEQLFKMIEYEIENGNIRKIDPRELMINIISLCIFPYAAKPLMNELFFSGNKKEYDRFLQSRKDSIKEFVINSISTR